MKLAVILSGLVLLSLSLVSDEGVLPEIALAQDGETEAVQTESGHILWDRTHGVNPAYSLPGDSSGLFAMLDTLGYHVSFTDVSVDSINLSSYSILVVSCITAWESAYTDSEVEVIEAFVSGGGGLLVLAENPETPCGPNLSPLTEVFGTSIAISYPEPRATRFSTFAEHVFFKGVTMLCIPGVGEIEATAPAMEVAWTSNGEALISVTDTNRVVVIGDATIGLDPWFLSCGNEVFLKNVFDWFSATYVGVESTSWSNAKALFR